MQSSFNAYTYCQQRREAHRSPKYTVGYYSPPQEAVQNNVAHAHEGARRTARPRMSIRSFAVVDSVVDTRFRGWSFLPLNHLLA